MKAKNLSIFCLVSILLTGCAPKAYSPPAPPVKISKPSSEEQSAFQKAIIESSAIPSYERGVARLLRYDRHP